MNSIQSSFVHSMIPLQTTPIKSIKSFRGRSMQSSPLRDRLDHIHPNISNTVKVNIKKFPLGFFAKTKNEGKLQTQYPRVKLDKPIRKTSACMLAQETYNENLPEAQITSFFKSAKEPSDTFDTNLSGNEYEVQKSENNFTVSDQDQLNVKDISTLTGCNDKQLSGNELCLTFSKIAPSTSSFRVSKCHDKTIKGEVQSESKNSNKLRRPLTKLETRGLDFENGSKNVNKNFNQNFNSLRIKLQLLETKSARASRNIDMLFPKISKNNI